MRSQNGPITRLAGKSALLVFGAMIAAGRLATGSVFDQPEFAQQLTDAQRKGLLAERDRLRKETDQLTAQGEIKSALAVGEKYLSINRRLFGNVHADVAEMLAWIAARHEILEQFDAALESRKEALAIRIKLHGDRHWQVTDARLSLQHAEFLSKLSADQRARLREANRLATEGESHWDAGRVREALVAATGERAIIEALLGKEHPDTAGRLNNLGLYYYAMGDHAAAEPLLQQALGIRKKVLGEEHPDTAMSLGNLGVLYKAMGDYASASPLYHQALEIHKKVHGEGHPDTAMSLGNLGMLYQEMGDYARAVPLCLQALGIFKKVHGEEHPTTAMGLNNLGFLYHKIGDNARAAPLLHQALEIHKKVHGEGHHYTATSLNNLGDLYLKLNDYARAEQFIQRALEIRRKVFGEEHAATSSSLGSLGELYKRMGDYARAEPLLDRALEIHKKVHGEEHSDTAASLHNLSELYMYLGDYARAAPLCQQALEIQKKVLGEEHRDTALSLLNLTYLYMAAGDDTSAQPLARRALASQITLVNRTAAVQSERQQLAMTAQLRNAIDIYLSVRGRTPAELQEVYASLLQWKGAVFLMQQRVLALRDAGSSDPKTARLFERLERVSVQLATLAFATPTPAQLAVRQRQIAELTDEQEALQRDLSARSAAFSALRQQSQLTVEQLQAVLPAKAALVDFLEYTHYERAAGGKERVHTERRLAAFVVRSSEAVTLVDLGPVAEIAEWIDEWRLSVLNRAGLADDAHPGHRLRKLVWEPLATALSEVETILLSPDGVLCQFPFGALPGQEPGTYLIEERAVAVIPVPQFLPELLAARRPPTADEPQVESLLLVGAVDYGGSPGAARDLRSGESRALPDDWRGGVLPIWPRLKASKSEIDQVGESFHRHFAGATLDVLHEEDATESAFRQQAGRHRVLHLATHGFFAPARLKSALAVNAEDANRSGLFARQGISGFHPGLLSGLALAGANVKPQEGEDNGVLTAIEVQGMDLRGVELVVLSACETGLGQVAGGEGVLGLQRAFQVAGARTVVASLWKVPDQSTSLLMRRFYANLWERKLSRLEALREAQLWVLRGGEDPSSFAPLPTNAVRRPPLAWAAFLLSGDWR